MATRAFPVVYATDVEAMAAFYERLGFQMHFRLPDEGVPGYVGMRRGASELAITTVESPRTLAGVEPLGGGPRFELFVYVDDVDGTIAALRRAGITVLRDAVDMPWGERVGFVADPEGNPVSLAQPTSG